MPVVRVLSSLAACAAVAGCAVVALGISSADSTPRAAAPSSVDLPSVHVAPSAAAAPRPLPRPVRSRPTAVARTSATAARSVTAPAPVATSPAPSHPAPARPVHPSVAASTPHPSPPRPTPTPTHRAPAAPAVPHVVVVRGTRLPLAYATGTATQVLTVVAHSHGSTTATLQAWTKVAGGWQRYGSAVTAHVGADGLGNASEYRSATPTGSFTLTHAFGYYGDPGTRLPYLHTTPADWWISQAGPLYNTHQRCSGRCPFVQGAPNEHLYYETPYYNYAVVIDYNTRNSPGGVQQGKGSAFFLHVTDGSPTAGCVAIPQSKLVALMRWLRPADHPRILIGVT